MYNPCWDMKTSPATFRKVLKNPGDRRFPDYFVRVLSWVPFHQVFHRYITPRQFKKQFPKVKRLLNADIAGAGRLEFWNWLYKKLP